MGFLVGIATALAQSLQNTYLRKIPEVPALQLNWLRFSVAAVVSALLVSVFYTWFIPPFRFWAIVVLSVPLELALTFCYVRSFQLSPQSLVGPLFSLSAIFLVPISYFLNQELPSLLGILGILSVLIGALGLGWDFQNPGVRSSVINIFHARGSRYMLGAAFGAGVSVAFAKYAYRYSPPLLFAFWVLTGLAIVHAPLALRKPLAHLRDQKKNALLATSFYSVGQALHYIGINLTLAAYFISFKRLSIVFDVLLGKLSGGDTHFRERLAGAVLMTIGVILIA